MKKKQRLLSKTAPVSKAIIRIQLKVIQEVQVVLTLYFELTSVCQGKIWPF